MEIEVNYVAIGVCAVLAMAIGAVWYGPLFGKRWAMILGVNMDDPGAKEKMQREAMPLYAIQFALVLFQAFVLAHYILGWKEAGGLGNALWIWIAFVVPTLAGSAMWTNESTRKKWERFLIQAGYQLVVFAMFGSVLGFWV